MAAAERRCRSAVMCTTASVASPPEFIQAVEAEVLASTRVNRTP